ncbi:MAG TPA: FlgD immunoglobulin-like domain containing protein [bacterium]|nr:FlgD immunoglobulin-like domain containing protein [bacterium]
MKPLGAHVQLDYPVGGEEFLQGETITIRWSELIAHDTQNWDLYFSEDGGGTWEVIKLDIAVESRAYQWTPLEISTIAARIRVVQDNAGYDYSHSSGDFVITIEQADEGDQPAEQSPAEFALFPNYPNPFSTRTTIRYHLKRGANVEIRVYNLAGRSIRTLVDRRQSADRYQVEWDGRTKTGQHASSGTYIVQMEAEAFRRFRVVTLIR